jgi:hypothetical protein
MRAAARETFGHCSPEAAAGSGYCDRFSCDFHANYCCDSN